MPGSSEPFVESGADPVEAPHVLREYALLADGERGALLGPRGDVAWLCAPWWDSDGVFSSLLGGPGQYLVQPRERFVWGGSYEPGSLIWRNRWTTTSGAVECREALAFPGDPQRLVLLRRVQAADGPARLRVVLDPRAGFGRDGLRELRRDDDGLWHARVGEMVMRWSGGADAREEDEAGPRLVMDLDVARGEQHELVLELATGELPDEAPDAQQLWRATQTAWERATDPAGSVLSGSAAPRDAQHAVAVLRGLTSASGGMVAAATTSLPERFEAGRNYDYRYVWVRDQCYAGQAAAVAGVDELLDAAVRFLTERVLADGASLAPAYTVRGDPVPDETRLGLPGYPGGGDRVGNHVNAQFQLDAFGEVLLLLAAAARRGRLDSAGWRAAEVAAAAVASRWTEPDAGVWELDDRHWTHSRLVCAAGLRAMAGGHGATSEVRTGSSGPGPGDWLSLADRLVAEVAATATHPSGRWQRAPDDPGLDGALLLAAIRGAVPAQDPRSVETLRAYLAELTSEGYAYRFRHDQRPLGDAEGAFLLCNFLVALACQQQGDRLTAARFFDRGRSGCGPPGLFSEEFDVTQRQLRGNLPQAFVHAVALEAAVRCDLGPPGAGATGRGCGGDR